MLQPDAQNRDFNVILHKYDYDFWEFNFIRATLSSKRLAIK